jgi:hypothetical protein
MWPFGPKKSLSELAIERAPELVRLTSKSWPKFLRELAASDRELGFETPELGAKIFFFANRATEAFRKAQPKIRSLPDLHFFEVIGAGVVVSGTNTIQEVEAATGITIPPHLTNMK